MKTNFKDVIIKLRKEELHSLVEEVPESVAKNTYTGIGKGPFSAAQL